MRSLLAVDREASDLLEPWLLLHGHCLRLQQGSAMACQMHAASFNPLHGSRFHPIS